MTDVRFEQVWKLFGEAAPAVANLNLHIREGEFLVLVGPSGCGKTTSLRLLAGLERPTFGRIWFGERDVTTLPPGERDVAMVFQSYALYPNMTVYKNLSFGPTVRKEDRKDLRRRIDEVAEILGIGGLLNRRPTELSGGQRQRVALGRALLRESQLFLLDEPLSNLDAALRVQMRAELIRLHKRLTHTTACTSPTTRSRRSPWATASRSSRMATSCRSTPLPSCTTTQPTRSWPLLSARRR